MFTRSFLRGSAIPVVLVVAGCSTAAFEQPAAVQPAPPGTMTPAGMLAGSRVPPTPDEVRAVGMVGHIVKPGERDFTEARMRQLDLPAGFGVAVFADGLENPRTMLVMDNGDVYVSEREAGRVSLLRDADGDGRAEVRRPVVTGLGTGLEGVHGLATDGRRLFMVTDRELYVADIASDGGIGTPQRVIDDLPDGGQHPNRTMRYRDGALYLSIGSTCNACQEPNEEAATLLRVNPQTWQRTIFARGLRNTIGFDWHPSTGQLWGMDHNTDWRGDDFPLEELNRIQEGRHYGWPHCAMKQQVDPFFHGEPPAGLTREQHCARTEPSVMEYTAHAAPMLMAFYDGGMFPAEYRNDAFVAMRGSWNRNPPAGYSIVRIRFDDAGSPTGFEDFVTGWLIEDGEAHFGRPTGIAVARDGALLVADDHNGVIYRIASAGR